MKLRYLTIGLCLAALVAIGTAWAVSYTTNKGYPLPTVGGDVNVWGQQLNLGTNIQDTNMGGTSIINVAGSSNITATAIQAQALIQNLTGTLTGNINYILPALGGFYIIKNTASGAFNITVKTSAGESTGTIVPNGTSMHVYSDGTNIVNANGPFFNPSFGQTPVGAGMEYWGTTAPTGWIFAYGQSLLNTTCPALFAVIGTTFGGGAGPNFNAPDMRGRTAIGKDNMGGSAANRMTAGISGINGTVLGFPGGNEAMQAHIHTANVTDPGHIHSVTDPGHNHSINDPGHAHGVQLQVNGGGAANGVATSIAGGPTGGETTATVATGITNNAAVTNLTVDANTTGITAAITSTGAGASQNVQPGIVANYIINAGGSCS